MLSITNIVMFLYHAIPIFYWSANLTYAHVPLDISFLRQIAVYLFNFKIKYVI
jgi:hypothetical protein